MIKQCGETWAVASRDHSKSAQVARPVSSMNAVAGFRICRGPPVLPNADEGQIRQLALSGSQLASLQTRAGGRGERA